MSGKVLYAKPARMPATNPPVITITKTSAEPTASRGCGAGAPRPRGRSGATAATSRSTASRRRSANASARCAVRRNCDTRGSSTRPLCTMYQPSAPCSAAEHEDRRRACARSRAECAAREQPQRTAPGTRRRSARPSSRCEYSHQKMPLNSASDMPWLTERYSGVAWYLANAACQSASDSGGSVPDDGLPFGDRQARMRETGHAADDDHREHQRAAREEPRGHDARARAGPIVERNGTGADDRRGTCHADNYPTRLLEGLGGAKYNAFR